MDVPQLGSMSSSSLAWVRLELMARAAVAAAMALAAVALIDGGGGACRASSALAVSPFGTVEVSINPPPASRPTLSRRMATAVAWSLGIPKRDIKRGIASSIRSLAARPVTTMFCLLEAML